MLPPVAVVSIPKGGTHLLFQLLKVLGYRPGGVIPLNPQDGFWYSLTGGNSHTSCDWLRGIQPYHPVTTVPVLFIYRSPLDIVVSEANYIHLDGKTAFWSYYSGLSTEERVLKLIDDPWMLGSIRSRMAYFIGWLEVGNVIPISFEELVGAKGGGDDAVQFKLIGSILEKLDIQGDPVAIGEQLFGSGHTFRAGQIGAHKSVFTKQCYKKFAMLDQDFMISMGYAPITVSWTGRVSVSDTLLPARIDEFRRRQLIISEGAVNEVPNLVQSDFMGHNIVLYRRRYYALNRAAGHVDLTELAGEELEKLIFADGIERVRALVAKTASRGQA